MSLGTMEGAESGYALISGWIPRLQTALGKKGIAEVIAQRRIAEAYDPLFKLLVNTKDLPARIAIWNALAQIADPSSINDLIEKMHGGTPEELRAAETAIVEAALRDPDAAHRGLEVLQAYRAGSGNDDEQAALLRTMCRIGNKGALPDILKALADKNTKLRFNAALALAEWPNAEPLPPMMGALNTEKDGSTRLNLIKSIGDLALKTGDVPQEEAAHSLIGAYNGAAKDPHLQQIILDALSHVADPSVAAFSARPCPQGRAPQSQMQGAFEAVKAALAKIVPTRRCRDSLARVAGFPHPGPLLFNKAGVIINWYGIKDEVGWLVKIDKPGDYEIQLTQASASTPPGRYLFSFGRESFPRSVESTKVGEFKSVTVGHAKFTKPGFYRMWIRPLEIPTGGQLMQLKDGSDPHRVTDFHCVAFVSGTHLPWEHVDLLGKRG